MEVSRVFASVILFFSALCIYSITNYGGIREADSEIVFRVTESLAARGDFEVTSQLNSWRGFGVAPGKNGKLYSVFGPLQSVLLVPILKIAQKLKMVTNWPKDFEKIIPISYWVNSWKGDSFGFNERPKKIEPHALRFLVSWANPIFSAAGVVL
ncbi:hypothetical protein HYY75_01015, partial [bacterium]|nr:hypothetical protein [bacterium]